MKYASAIFILLFLACSTPRQSANNNAATGSVVVPGKLFTAAYQQKAGEYRALCYQAYNFARLRLDDVLKTSSTKPRAIVTDIDETLLDNSAYAVHRAMQGLDYEMPSWYEWTAMGAADTVPGALSFVKYAASKGIEIYYITNREDRERTGTLANLNKFKFPNVDEKHLITKSGTSSKEARRMDVLKTHDIVMLLGDNLADFTGMFDKKATDERNMTVDNNASMFGNKFIIIPNPVYGDWEGALYKYNWGFTAAQKDSAIRAAVKNY